MKRPFTKILPYYTQREKRVIWYVVNHYSHQGRKFKVCLN